MKHHQDKMSSQVTPSNRPEDTAFRQQRLKAWQPILTPLWVILTFVVIGVCFIPIGIVLRSSANSVFEQIVVYDSTHPDVDCRITKINQGYEAIQNSNPISCFLNFTFTQDIPLGTTVNVYYQLTNFYQNHRRYVKSRNDLQVGGNFVADATLQTSCDPNASYVSSETGLIYAPCGLIATSYFNDAFYLSSYSVSSSYTVPVTLDEKNIAWTTDINTKFMNPTNPPGSTIQNQPLNNWGKYQYLWQTYDQMSCYDSSTGARLSCLTWADLVGPGTYGQGCARCPAGARIRYEGGIAPPNGSQNFDPTPGIPGSATVPYGYRDEHFLVWMRTAGLPTFRKLYGTLTPPTYGFRKGDSVLFEVVPNFEVASFQGTKALIISTVTPTGGKSSVLGSAYLAVGSICLALAVAFAIKHFVSPRKLGDPQYIVWRHAKQ